MKRFIYTALLVFSALFSQAFGGQNELPTIHDTTICMRKGDTIKVYEYQEQILRLLESREKEIWKGCCDGVSVELKGVSSIDIDHNTSSVKTIEGWPAVIINGNLMLSLGVTYVRHLRCSDILKCKEDATPESVAMWHFFGKLVTASETGAVTKISDTAFVSTEHKVKLQYQIGMSFPDIDFKIQGDSCITQTNPNTILTIPSGYESCQLKWKKPDNVNFANESDTADHVIVVGSSDDLFPIVCMAISCTGDTASDTIRIGKPTPVPEIEDLGCIAANDTSFRVEVNNSNSRWSYHWTVEDLERGDTIETQQGASVTMSIPQSKSLRLRLHSSGGCKDAEMEPVILYRSLVPEVHHIEMEPVPHCIFEGDTLRFFLSEMPEDTLVWQIADNDKVVLQPHDICSYQALQAKENVLVSVYAKSCPDNIITDTFNIRKDLAVSIDPNETCISAHTGQTFKVIGNGIKPEVHWYGNGVEIDTSIYGRPDSIRLRLTNPGGDNVYVSVKAKECDRESRDTLVLRPKPEIPQLDTLWNALTPCIPLGKADTIELRVEPQAGVSFEWFFSESSKFKGIGKSDSNTIRVRVDYALSDRETDIPVRVRAYTEGCPDSATIEDVLYATGAGIGKEWDVIQQLDEEDGEIWGYIIGFSEDGQVVKDYGSVDPFEGRYTFDWYAEECCLENNTGCGYYFFTEEVDAAFDIFCRLTSKESQCYSIYTTVAGEAARSKLQRETPATSEAKPEARKAPESSQGEEREKEATACPGIVLHPNPVRSGKCVKAEGLSETESFTVECYTQQGRFLFRSAGQGATCTIPTGAYAPGVYIIRIQRSGKAMPIVKKLIVI